MLRAVRVARAGMRAMVASDAITRRGRASHVGCQPPTATRWLTRRVASQQRHASRAGLEEVKRAVRPTVGQWAQRGLVLGPESEGLTTTSSSRHRALPRVEAAEAAEMLGRALHEQHPIIITGMCIQHTITAVHRQLEVAMLGWGLVGTRVWWGLGYGGD